MDIIIEPYVSLGINVAVDEVNLAFALVPFSIFANISSGGYRSCLIVLDSLRRSQTDSRRNIIHETLTAIWSVLKDRYLRPPENQADWLRIFNEFETVWNLPHCVGAIRDFKIGDYGLPTVGREAFGTGTRQRVLP